MSNEVSKHQQIMSAAYDRWQGQDWSKEQFIAQLGPVEYEAVIVGNLNYQVENGGWMQWVDNQYYTPETAASLIRIMTRMGTPASLKVKELLEKAVTIIEKYGPEPTDEEDYEMFYEALDPLCSEFYAVNGQMMAEFEAQLP